MDINELAKNLCDCTFALELITWLRENKLLADNSGDVTTDTQLAEQFAFFRQEDSEILVQIRKLLVGSKQGKLECRSCC